MTKRAKDRRQFNFFLTHFSPPKKIFETDNDPQMIEAGRRTREDLQKDFDLWEEILVELQQKPIPDPYFLRERPELYLSKEWLKGCRDQKYDCVILWGIYRCDHRNGHLFPLAVSGPNRRKYLDKHTDGLCAACKLDAWLATIHLDDEKKDEIRMEKLRELYRT